MKDEVTQTVSLRAVAVTHQRSDDHRNLTDCVTREVHYVD
jgi:hypothetical protein